VRLGACAGVRDGAVAGVAHGLRILPQRAEPEVVEARPPDHTALGEMAFGDFQLDAARLGIERDDVAVLGQRDRPRPPPPSRLLLAMCAP
jgi:hypothetical protein